MNTIFLYFIVILSCICINAEKTPPADLNRITNGNIAAQNQFPYAASLQFRPQAHQSTRGHRCGATLITYQHALTAASKLFDQNFVTGALSLINAAEYHLFAGSTNLANNQIAQYVRNVANFTVNPDFIYAARLNDIAVITVVAPFPINVSVRPMSLPPSSFNPADFTRCTTAGWGQSNISSAMISEVLLYTDKYVYTHDFCTLYYLLDFKVFPSMICAASYNSASSCAADIGNGLVCDGRLTGVVILGPCAREAARPEVYTQVPKYSSWIRNVTGGAGIMAPKFSFVLLFLIVLCYI